MRNHKVRFLKIKLKSLAEESRIIRKEEKRSRDPLREQLYLHRIHDVRDEARATHIAYGYLRGRALAQMEKSPDNIPSAIWARAQKMVDKYGVGKNEVALLDEWRKPTVTNDSQVLPSAVASDNGRPGTWVRLKRALGHLGA
jgi:hypothetical protein